MTNKPPMKKSEPRAAKATNRKNSKKTDPKPPGTTKLALLVAHLSARAARPSPNSVRQRAGNPIRFEAHSPVRCDARVTSSGPGKRGASGATASRN